MKIKSIKKRKELVKVYDIINSGPEHNFLVKTNSNKYIVLHNSFLESLEDSNKSVEGNYDAAESMYYAIYNRMLSRFSRNGKLPGIIAMVSSPQFPNDFMSRKIEEAINNPDSGIFWRRRSTWEAKGEKFFPESSGHFFIDTENSEIIKDVQILKFLSSLNKNKFPMDLDIESIAKISSGLKTEQGVKNVKKNRRF